MNIEQDFLLFEYSVTDTTNLFFKIWPLLQDHNLVLQMNFNV